MAYTGGRQNADVHRALELVKKFNQPRTVPVDEAPYGLINRTKDAVKATAGKLVGKGQMSLGRIEAGRLADDLNKQYLQFLGQRGHKNQTTATIKT